MMCCEDNPVYFLSHRNCGNQNFAWRNECNRCKTPRADGGGDGGGE